MSLNSPDGFYNMIQAETAFYHARDKVKGRYVEGEYTISKNPMYAFLYARDILHGRFLQGEPAMKRVAAQWIEYKRFLSEIGIALDGEKPLRPCGQVNMFVIGRKLDI